MGKDGTLYTDEEFQKAANEALEFLKKFRDNHWSCWLLALQAAEHAAFHDKPING